MIFPFSDGCQTVLKCNTATYNVGVSTRLQPESTIVSTVTVTGLFTVYCVLCSINVNISFFIQYHDDNHIMPHIIHTRFKTAMVASASELQTDKIFVRFIKRICSFVHKLDSISMFARKSVQLTKTMGLFCIVWTSHIQFTLQAATRVKCDCLLRPISI